MSISLKEFMEAGGMIDEANSTSNIDGGEGQTKTPEWVSKKKKGKGKSKEGKVGKGKITTGEGGHKKPDVFGYKVVTNNSMNEELTKEDMKEIRDIIRDEVSKLSKQGKTINLSKLGSWIRREQAGLFFDLFKKRNVWMT
tara:strand:+ start:167 stop:586 length:420 start_codon:yes stop_codon:yes gene_type:complete